LRIAGLDGMGVAIGFACGSIIHQIVFDFELLGMSTSVSSVLESLWRFRAGGFLFAHFPNQLLL